MTVDRALIQPPGDDLIDHAGVVRRIERLARRPGIRAEVLARSREGRAVPAIVIGADDQTPLVAPPRVSHDDPAGPGVLTWDRPQGTARGRVPVLLLASNYGNEAAQVEALLQLAEQIAERRSQGPDPTLDRLVVLIVPLLNPDGYERALRTWRRTPVSPGLRAYGNHYDVQVAREYLHLLEPETVGLADLVRRWHPYVVWEVHEDSINLGRIMPETCLSPPLAPADEVGLAVLGRPGDNHPGLVEQERRFGAAIADAWRAAGFPYLHDPEGRHGWLRPVDPRYAHLEQHPETRFTRTMALRGVTTFITESSRLPGAHTWTDRVAQKVAAGWATLEAAAVDPDGLVAIADEVARDGTEAGEGAYLLPADQPAQTLARAVQVLRAHGISCIETADEAMADGGVSYVVPASQPGRRVLELLLDLEIGRHQSLVATSNLRVVRRRDAAQRLRPRPSTGRVAVVPHAEVPTPPGRRVAPLGAPATVGVLAVQGIVDFAAEGYLGGVLRALDGAHVPYRTIAADQLRAGLLDGLDVLVVPNGDASAIVSGSRHDTLWHGPPWDPEEPTIGIGPEGLEAIRHHVAAGGTYVGVDGGGGILATSEHLGLLHLDVVASNLGTGLVELNLTDVDDPLFDGAAASYDADGTERRGRIHAFVCSNPYIGEAGAHVFAARGATELLASFERSLPVPGVAHLNAPPATTDPRERAAIVRGRYGRGTATVFAIEPTYRSLSTSGARLLVNAVRAGVGGAAAYGGDVVATVGAPVTS